MNAVTLQVNGTAHTVDVEPSTRLLYVLRNDLGLQGPRFGCGLGQCGACTVIIDSVATRSCVTPTSRVRGEITTLEGLAQDGTLDPVQQAWIDEQVPACWLLSEWADHDRQGPARPESKSDGCRDS